MIMVNILRWLVITGTFPGRNKFVQFYLRNIQAKIRANSLKDFLVDLNNKIDILMNTKNSEENIEEVRKTIFSFEKIYDEKASDKKCAKNTEKIINTYKRIRDKGTFAPLRLYPLLYAVLMEMCIIQIEHPNYSVDNKMKLLCTFMNNEVCRILYPELILAKQYFEKGQGYSFFGKIQKGRNDLLKTIHNMTWDLLHLRTLEIDFTVNPISISDINIPFFSHMIKDCWKLKNAMNYHQLP